MVCLHNSVDCSKFHESCTNLTGILIVADTLYIISHAVHNDIYVLQLDLKCEKVRIYKVMEGLLGWP